MPNNLFGHGSFFGGGVSLAVLSIGAGGNESTETFIARMGGDVDAPAAKNIVIRGDDDVGCVVIVLAHDTYIYAGRVVRYQISQL